MINIIEEKVLLVNISKTYDMYDVTNDNTLYDITRAAWRANRTNLNKVDYVFGVVNNKIITIYAVDEWIAATAIRKDLNSINLHKRYMFNSNFTIDLSKLIVKYKNKELSEKYKFSQNPIKYVNVKIN